VINEIIEEEIEIERVGAPNLEIMHTDLANGIW